MTQAMAKKVKKLDNSLIMKLLSSLFVCLLLSSTQVAYGQSISIKGLTINAEHSELLISEGKIILSGNVQIIANNHYIQAQKASIFKNQSKILAQGDVIIKSPEFNVEAEKISFNYKTKTGFFTQAKVDWGNAQFEGEHVERISATEFLATKSKFTTCNKSCSPVWKFSGKKIVAKKEGYAAITRPVFRIKNIPIFMLPKIWLPIKSQRQTGFLAPSIEFSSSGGFTIEESLFITAGRSFDFTLTPKLYEKRGFKFINEFRFALSEKFKGNISAGFIRDKAFQEDLEQSETSSKNRGFGVYNHKAELAKGIQSKTHLVFVNDLRYIRDFNEEIDEHGRSSIESKASLYKSYKDYYTGLQIVHNKNLLKQDSFADNKEAQHKLPEIFLSVTNKEISKLKLNYGLDINYLNIYSSKTDYADINNNNSFDPGTDIIRTGQRAIISPRIFLPIKLGQFFTVVPRLNYSEYLYKFSAKADENLYPNYSSRANTSYTQFDIATQTYFSKIYNRKNRAYRHEIEPEITFSSGSISKDTDHPFFGDFADRQYDRRFENISDTDLDTNQGVQFDYLDRLTNNRIIELGITQRLIRKTVEDNKTNYKQILYFRVSQFYDFKEKERAEEDPEPWSDISARFNLKYDKFQLHTDLLFLPYERRMNNSTRLRYHYDKNRYYSIGFTQSFQPSNISSNNNEEIVYNFSDRNELLNIGLGIKTKTLSLSGTLDYSTINNEFQSWNYVLSWLPPGDCIELSFAHRRRIDSDENFKINFKLLFGNYSS